MPYTVYWNVPKMSVHSVTVATEPKATQPRKPRNRSCPSNVPGTIPFFGKVFDEATGPSGFFQRGQEKQHGPLGMCVGCQKSTHHPRKKKNV